MILGTKFSLSIIIFVFSSLLSINADEQSSDKDSDEDDKLKQALILVNILKSEYIKALRQNTILPDTSTDVEYSATCPTTSAISSQNNDSTSDTNDTSSININKFQSPTVNSLAVTPSSMSHNISQFPAPFSSSPPLQLSENPTYKNDFQNSHRYFRRMMPMDYYDYDYPRQRRGWFFRRNGFPMTFRRQQMDKLRQLDYEDMFGEHPHNTDTTEPSTTSIKSRTNTITEPNTLSTFDTKFTEKVSLDISEISPDDTTITMQTTTLTTTINSVPTPQKKGINNNSSTTIPHNKNKVLTADYKSMLKGKPKTIANMLVLTTTKETKTKDPVVSQVALELINEFKQEGITMKVDKIKNVSSKRSSKTKIAQQSQTIYHYPTTIKIHLASSTRYPIPLPENHAFCYTNPNNPLCRTII